ncbi:MAG: integrase domain-containing protein [Rhodospirillales bacterium]|nr:integrase domain-containing protein [Rhodospirillales bacterium]
MRQLNHDLKRLQDDARDGAYGTRSGRSFNLAQMANTLHELGYRRLRATGLRGKHVEALVREWKRTGLTIGTMKNRMSHLRWWAKRVGKPNVVRADNASYGIGERKHANEDKSTELPPEKLALVKDDHVRMALGLQEQFGLRREEAIKFSPSYADRGSKIVLKASWTKGGRAREIPVLHEAQRRVLDEARSLAGGGAMIPGHRNYVQQLEVYERQTAEAGLERMHGLRHGYAQRRYEEIAGWKCPAAGGPPMRSLKGARKRIDREARATISREMGHSRIAIVQVYLAA